MTATILGLLGVVAGFVLRALANALFVGEIKGLWKDHLRHVARRAAEELPADIADDILAEWLEELATLEDRPLRAWRFAHGLSRAALRIAANDRTQEPTLLLLTRRLRGLARPRAFLVRFSLATAGVFFAARLNPRLVPLLLLGSAFLYATRVAVHARIGYWAPSSAAGSTDRRLLRRFVAVEAVVATGWVAGGLVLVALPNPLIELLLPLALLVVVGLLAAGTVSAAEAVGMPRGSDVVERSRVMVALRSSAMRLGPTPIQRLVRILEARTPVDQVSPLVLALLATLALSTVVAGLALLLQIIFH